MTAKTHAGIGLAAAAGIIVTIELGRYWALGHELHWAPFAVAAVLGFLGGYLMDSGSAKDAGKFVVDGAVSLITAVRAGRRAYDPVVAPVDRPETPPAVTRKSDAIAPPTPVDNLGEEGV
jgi:hypothetical protein